MQMHYRERRVFEIEVSDEELAKVAAAVVPALAQSDIGHVIAPLIAAQIFHQLPLGSQTQFQSIGVTAISQKEPLKLEVK